MAVTTVSCQGIEDLWEWDGYDWYEITPETSLPTGAIQPGMTYDSYRNRIVEFGGIGSYYGQETWEYYNTDPGVCNNLGVTLTMPSDYYRPGDECFVTGTVCNNTGMTLTGFPLLVILDVYGTLFWGPEFTEEFETYLTDYPQYTENETIVNIVPSFTWPDTGTTATGITFYAAVTDPCVSFLYGDMDSFEFGWGM